MNKLPDYSKLDKAELYTQIQEILALGCLGSKSTPVINDMLIRTISLCRRSAVQPKTDIRKKVCV